MTIFADTVQLQAPIVASGQNITIYAREVSFGPTGRIDVSGSAGQDWPQGDHAPEGTTIQMPEAQAGGDGDSGRSGSDAGHIQLKVGSIVGPIVIVGGGRLGWQTSATIALAARGGNGGRGRDGGNGAPGAHGGDRHDTYERGGDGGRGGRAGAGGDGGPGGAGGGISVSVVQPLTKVIILNDAAGGLGGGPGNAGAPGAPGPAGHGDCPFHFPSCPAGPQIEGTIVYSGDGNSGAPGQGPDHNAVKGSDGAKGTSNLQQQVLPTMLGQQWNSDHLLMMLHHVELDYLNGDYGICALRANWLRDITAGNASQNDVYVQASAVLQQMAAGLDFYGKPPNYVPLTPITDIEPAVADALGSGEAVETSFLQYFQQTARLEDKKSSLQNSLSEVSASLKQSNDQLDDILSNRPKIESDINDLTQSPVFAVRRNSKRPR